MTKTYMEYSNKVNDIYQSIDGYNPEKTNKNY